MATPHKHAELIKKWADDPSQPVWYWTSDEWYKVTTIPMWHEHKAYALGQKPTRPPVKMCKLAGVEFPAPETKAPAYGSFYYFPFVSAVQYYSEYVWSGDPIDTRLLAAGQVHLTEEAAEAHSKALRSGSIKPLKRRVLLTLVALQPRQPPGPRLAEQASLSR